MSNCRPNVSSILIPPVFMIKNTIVLHKHSTTNLRKNIHTTIQFTEHSQVFQTVPIMSLFYDPVVNPHHALHLIVMDFQSPSSWNCFSFFSFLDLSLFVDFLCAEAGHVYFAGMLLCCAFPGISHQETHEVNQWGYCSLGQINVYQFLYHKVTIFLLITKKHFVGRYFEDIMNCTNIQLIIKTLPTSPGWLIMNLVELGLNT